jgi:hypothetical protein
MKRKMKIGLIAFFISFSTGFAASTVYAWVFIGF